MEGTEEDHGGWSSLDIGASALVAGEVPHWRAHVLVQHKARQHSLVQEDLHQGAGPLPLAREPVAVSCPHVQKVASGLSIFTSPAQHTRGCAGVA